MEIASNSPMTKIHFFLSSCDANANELYFFVNKYCSQGKIIKRPKRQAQEYMAFQKIWKSSQIHLETDLLYLSHSFRGIVWMGMNEQRSTMFTTKAFENILFSCHFMSRPDMY